MNVRLDQLDASLNAGLTVFEYYYQQIIGKPLGHLNGKMISPFLREDGQIEKDASFSVFLHSRKNTYFFKDHGIDKSGTHWQFVMDLFGLDFKMAVSKVKADLLGMIDGKVGQLKTTPVMYQSSAVKKSTRAEITPGFRDWEADDLDYYGSAKISLPTLNAFHCKPLSHFEIKKENKTHQILCRDLQTAYCYTFPSGHHKIVQPFGDERFKWSSNLVAEMDVFGFDLVPKECEHLFIIGGNRDAMSFYENIGLPVIALASESANISDELLTILRRIAKNIYVLYDNDPQGHRKAKKFNEEYGFTIANHLYGGNKDFCKIAENQDSLNLFKAKLESELAILSLESII